MINGYEIRNVQLCYYQTLVDKWHLKITWSSDQSAPHSSWSQPILQFTSFLRPHKWMTTTSCLNNQKDYDIGPSSCCILISVAGGHERWTKNIIWVFSIEFVNREFDIWLNIWLSAAPFNYIHWNKVQHFGIYDQSNMWKIHLPIIITFNQ